jgi:hypothetical protein
MLGGFACATGCSRSAVANAEYALRLALDSQTPMRSVSASDAESGRDRTFDTTRPTMVVGACSMREFRQRIALAASAAGFAEPNCRYFLRVECRLETWGRFRTDLFDSNALAIWITRLSVCLAIAFRDHRSSVIVGGDTTNL